MLWKNPALMSYVRVVTNNFGTVSLSRFESSLEPFQALVVQMCALMDHEAPCSVCNLVRPLLHDTGQAAMHSIDVHHDKYHCGSRGAIGGSL